MVACHYIMKKETKERTKVKFCVGLEKLTTETLKMLRQAYGDEAMSRTQYFKRIAVGIATN